MINFWGYITRHTVFRTFKIDLFIFLSHFFQFPYFGLESRNVQFRLNQVYWKTVLIPAFWLVGWSWSGNFFADVAKETVQNLNSKFFYIIFLKVSLRVDDRILNWVCTFDHGILKIFLLVRVNMKMVIQMKLIRINPNQPKKIQVEIIFKINKKIRILEIMKIQINRTKKRTNSQG